MILRSIENHLKVNSRVWDPFHFHLRMMKNAFYFMLKALSVLKMFTFLSLLFGYAEKRLDKKTRVNFKIYDVTDWTANNCNTLFPQ